MSFLSYLCSRDIIWENFALNPILWFYLLSSFDTIKNAACHQRTKRLQQRRARMLQLQPVFWEFFNIHSTVVASCSVCMNFLMHKIYKRRTGEAFHTCFELSLFPWRQVDTAKSNDSIYLYVGVKCLFIDLLFDGRDEF